MRKRHYQRRAVDQDGDVIDILVQRYRNARAAKRFFRKLLKGQGSTPCRLARSASGRASPERKQTGTWITMVM